MPRFDRGLARLDFSESATIAPGIAPARTDPNTGFVRVSAFLARDGLLTYGDGEDSWQEIRPREELVRAALSFADAPLTDLHPSEMVTIDTWEDVARGHIIGQPYVTEPDETGISYLAADLMITSADLLSTIRDGQRELSIGFWARIVDAPEATGARFAQVDMLGNHVASVPRGRAGAACRVFLDHAASCAYDRDVSESREDLQAAEMVDYALADGRIVQIPTEIAAQMEQYQTTIAQLSEKAAEPPKPEEPDMPEQDPDQTVDPSAETQPLDVVPPEPQPEGAAPEPDDEDRRDSVALPVATARSVIEARMPHMKGKLDGLDLSTLLAAALAMPEPEAQRTDAAPEPSGGNPFAQPTRVEQRVDECDAKVGEYLKSLGLAH